MNNIPSTAFALYADSNQPVDKSILNPLTVNGDTKEEVKKFISNLVNQNVEHVDVVIYVDGGINQTPDIITLVAECAVNPIGLTIWHYNNNKDIAVEQKVF